MIKINEEKCIGCLNCVDKCICRALEIQNGKPIFRNERGCVKCMHCAIACLQNAITYNGEAAVMEKCEMISHPSFAAELKQFLMQKRSYRNFSDKPVPIEIVHEALNTALWAPSAKNQHPTKYFIINGRSKIDKMMQIILKFIQETGTFPEITDCLKRGHNKVFGKSQSIIIAYAQNDANRPMEDTIVALTYADLLLQAEGIGTCWSGYLQWFLNHCSELAELLPIPENHSFYGCMLLGYPTEKFFYIPKRIGTVVVDEIR